MQKYQLIIILSVLIIISLFLYIYKLDTHNIHLDENEIFQPLIDMGYIIIYSKDNLYHLKIDAPENYSLINEFETTDASVTVIGENKWTNKLFKINDINKLFIGPYTKCILYDKNENQYIIENNTNKGKFIFLKDNSIYIIKIFQSENTNTFLYDKNVFYL